MTAQLTYEQRLGSLDREVESLQRAFVEAVDRLRDAPEVDGSHEERWGLIAGRMKGLREEIQPEDYDKGQLADLMTALLDIRDLLDRPDASGNLEVCDLLMIALERIRHVVRDALDEHVDGAGDDVGAVMGELDGWLAHVADRRVAELVGVDRRTLTRWRHSSGPPQRTLRLFARLVAILRHSWDEEGIVAWFSRSRRDLGGRTPASLLADPSFEDELIAAARSGRSQYAA